LNPQKTVPKTGASTNSATPLNFFIVALYSV